MKEKICAYIDEELEYQGSVEIYHLLQILIKYKNTFSEICKPICNFAVAPYYGCLLLRPKDIRIDDSENPQIIQELVRVTGVSIVEYPYMNECCGSYQNITSEILVKECIKKICESAKSLGAQAIITSCPLCHFNLDTYQNILPVLYISQLLAVSAGIDKKYCGFDLHNVNPVKLFEK